MFYLLNDEELNDELKAIALDIIDDLENGWVNDKATAINDKLDYCFNNYGSFEKYKRNEIECLFDWAIGEE